MSSFRGSFSAVSLRTIRCEMREVYIAAVGLTKVDLTGDAFGNVFDLFQSAYRRALDESELRDFDAVQVGIMDAEEFENRANIATKVADRLGLVGVPAVRTETASSTGAAAFHEACYKIRSGAASTVLVIAGERMKTVTTQVATEIMSKTVDPVEQPLRLHHARADRARHAGVLPPPRHRRRACPRRPLAAHVPRAPDRRGQPARRLRGQARDARRLLRPTRNLPVATPLRRKDCSPICDGAAAIILTDRPQPVRVAGLGAATDTSSLLDRVELDSLGATRRAAAFALYQRRDRGSFRARGTGRRVARRVQQPPAREPGRPGAVRRGAGARGADRQRARRRPRPGPLHTSVERPARRLPGEPVGRAQVARPSGRRHRSVPAGRALPAADGPLPEPARAGRRRAARPVALDRRPRQQRVRDPARARRLRAAPRARPRAAAPARRAAADARARARAARPRGAGRGRDDHPRDGVGRRADPRGAALGRRPARVRALRRAGRSRRGPVELTPGPPRALRR